MHWQFGGNLQPVRMICEFDWRECPSALINYVWSEIVTDVVECLTNEWMMWRVIAMLFVCTLLIHTIYTKTKLMDETTTNRENLNVVGCRVQDLELKINILTYKMQYGTWPLPREIRGSGVERELKNVRLTLANSNDRNDWLKHMLLSPSENTSCIPYAKIGPRSVRCLTKLINLETKYMSSKFARDNSPISSKDKSSRSASEISIKYDKPSKKCFDSKPSRVDPKSENFATRNNESADLTRKLTNNCWSETRMMKYRDNPRLWMKNNHDNTAIKKNSSIKSYKSDKTPEDRVNTTNVTLNRVKEKLENLHSVLRIYGEPISKNQQTGTTNKELAESILRELKNLGNFADSESDGKTCNSLRQILHSNSEDCEKNDEETEEHVVDSTSEFEQCRSDEDFSSSSIIENREKNDNREKSIPQIVNIDEMKKQSVDKVKTTNLPGMIFKVEENSKSMNLSMASEKNAEKFKKENVAYQDSPISSAAEISKDSDNDDISNAALLREALEVKKTLVTRIELENNEKMTNEMRSESSESDETIWSKENIYFQPKILEIISEEQSASSSNEKTSKNLEKTIANNDKCDAEKKYREKSEISVKPSEYFSFCNIEEKMINTDEESGVYRENVKPDEENMEKHLSEIVDRSVKNIRDYIEAFSRMQNDAIIETKIAINDENTLKSEDPNDDEKNEISSRPRETSSIDSITRFVNTVSEPTIEELPRKLSEPAIIRLVDLELENYENDTDFELKRRPGSISLAKNIIFDEKSSEDNVDSIFESANSEIDDSPSISPMQLSDKSYGDFRHVRSYDTTNLMVFDEDIDSRFNNDENKSRVADSPLTGRTVIRATGSTSSDIDISFNESVESFDREETKIRSGYDRPENNCESEEKSLNNERKDEIITRNVIEETSSIYFTDKASFPEIARNSRTASDSSTAQNSVNSKIKPTVEQRNDDVFGKTEGDVDIFYDQPEVRSINNFEEFETSSRDESFIDKATVIAGNELNGRKPEVPPRNEIIVDGESKLKRRDVAGKKDETELKVEDSQNRPKSGDTIVINSPREKSRSSHFINESGLPKESSAIYMDASSHEFLNLSGTSLRLEKKFVGSSSSKSARGSYSSPLQHRIPWTATSRLTRSNLLGNAEKSDKYEKKTKDRYSDETRGSTKSIKPKRQGSKTSSKYTQNGLGTKSHLNLKGTKDLESSSIANGRGSAKVDLVERRSRSYATPRKCDNSPRNLANLGTNDTQRIGRTRKQRDFVKSESSSSPIVDETTMSSLNENPPRESADFENIDNRRLANTTKRNFVKNTAVKTKGEKNNVQIHEETWRSRSRKVSPSNTKFSEYSDVQVLRKDESADGIDVNTIKSNKSMSHVVKNSSKSSIPVLKSRLEAVRLSSQEKRAKSPARCPLTMSTSSWKQETQSVPTLSNYENVKAEGNVTNEKNIEERTFNDYEIDAKSYENLEKIEQSLGNNGDKLPDFRTVIYVNIVTEKEHKSATRVVDPKKFLEYLKDRELKIQSVQDQEITSEHMEQSETSSPRLLTIVSSAVDEETSERCIIAGRKDNKTSGTWSLRVEKREIEVSAKPSVIDTSTSISDFPDTIKNSRIAGNDKFEIFEVPKELTKDEYIVLLEALNQDPNLQQLREMHNLCDKLGLGFHE